MVEDKVSNEEKVAINDTIAKVYLSWASDLMENEEFNEALTKIHDAVQYANSQEVEEQINETEENTLVAYSNSSGTEARVLMSSTAGEACRNGTPASSPLIGSDESSMKVYTYLPGIPVHLSKELTATTPASMHHVACIETEKRKVQTCPYRSSSTGKLYFLERHIWIWDVTLRDVLTGEIIGEKQLQGPSPSPCGRTENFSTRQFVKERVGDYPEEKLNNWLNSILK